MLNNYMVINLNELHNEWTSINLRMANAMDSSETVTIWSIRPSAIFRALCPTAGTDRPSGHFCIIKINLLLVFCNITIGQTQFRKHWFINVFHGIIKGWTHFRFTEE
jgi:hypothetical protein